MKMEFDITGHTQLVGVIGLPTKYSMSPAMHSASFSKLGIDAVYLAFDVKPENLAQTVEAFKIIGVAGFNVTMPHKAAILPLMDELSPEARLMGAVNTVKIDEGKLYGFNTDGSGFLANVAAYGFEPKDSCVTILGAGGAASAIFTQLAIEGARRIAVFNKRDSFWDVSKARIEKLAQNTGVSIELYDVDDRDTLRKAIQDSAMLANATRVGMGDLKNECLVDEDMFHEGLLVTDTVYEPRETKLIKMAKAHGLTTAPGLGMLLQQAARSEKIWFDVDMPIDYIEQSFF